MPTVKRIGFYLLLGLNMALLALAAAQTSPAQAHTGSGYIRGWPINTTEDYYFDDDVPNDWRDHIAFGLDEWSNRVSGRSPAFVRAGQVNRVLDYAHICAGPDSYVFVRGDYEAHAGGIAGTALCPRYTDEPMQKFVIVFEESHSSGDWYVGSVDPPSHKWDLRSVATHESGHAAGFFRHFDEEGEACPNDNQDRSTMCNGRDLDLGTIYRRSLANEHDLHTLSNAYD